MDKPVNKIRAGFAELPPAYFALVMSTGIVSIACPAGAGLVGKAFILVEPGAPLSPTLRYLGFGAVACAYDWGNYLFIKICAIMLHTRQLGYKERELSRVKPGKAGRHNCFWNAAARVAA